MGLEGDNQRIRSPTKRTISLSKSMPTKSVTEPALPGQMDQGSLVNLLGYHLAQASIPTDLVFKNYIQEAFKLNKLEFTILILLQANEELTPKRLSTVLNIAAPNLTLILDRLEKGDLLTRIQSARDRRMQLVRLSEAGQVMATKLTSVSLSMEENIWKHLTSAEKQILLELLRKIAQHRRI
jgi:DNA-binding MarR family transcriptional regulator